MKMLPRCPRSYKVSNLKDLCGTTALPTKLTVDEVSFRNAGLNLSDLNQTFERDTDKSLALLYRTTGLHKFDSTLRLQSCSARERPGLLAAAQQELQKAAVTDATKVDIYQRGTQVLDQD